MQETPDRQERGRIGSIIIFSSHCSVFICLHLVFRAVDWKIKQKMKISKFSLNN